jgi:hypothetical protein
VGCAHAHLGPGCSWSLGGKLAGVGNRQRPAAVIAAARAPVRLLLGWTTNEPGRRVLPREGARGRGLERGRPEEAVLQRRRQWRGAARLAARGGVREGRNSPTFI